jgi:predicted enzyme related to lactoylglutathione lyase
MEPLPQKGFVWHELMTTDLDGAERFYKEVVDMSAMPISKEPGAYRIISFDDKQAGGLVGPRNGSADWPSGGPTPHWVPNFGVPDADAAADRAKALGGKILVEPTSVPGFGRAAVIRDPQGAVFGVFSPGAEA